MAPRTDPRVIAAICKLLMPADGSPGMRRSKAIIREIQALGLGTTSDVVIQKEAYRLGIKLETGPEVGAPGIGRPKGARDVKQRAARSDRGVARSSSGSVDELAAQAKASYAVTGSYRETARKLGLSYERIRQLVKLASTDDKQN